MEDLDDADLIYTFILGWMFFGWSMIDSIIEGAI